MNSVVLTIEPLGYPISIFRIYVERTAETYDVRLDGRGAPYVIFLDGAHPPVDNQRGPVTTAYDRVDDRFVEEERSEPLDWISNP